MTKHRFYQMLEADMNSPVATALGYYYIDGDTPAAFGSRLMQRMKDIVLLMATLPQPDFLAGLMSVWEKGLPPQCPEPKSQGPNLIKPIWDFVHGFPSPRNIAARSIRCIAALLLHLKDDVKVDMPTYVHYFELLCGKEYDEKNAGKDDLHNILLLSTRMMSVITFTSVKKTGVKTYRVLPGLESRLSNTELRGIKGKNIKLPFNGNIWVEMEHRCFVLSQTENVIHLTWIDEKNDKDTPFWCSWELTLEPDVPLQQQKINDDAIFRFVVNVVMYITNCHYREEFRQEPTNAEWVSLGERIQKLPAGAKKERLKERRRQLDPEYKIIIGKGVRSMQEEKDDLDKKSLSVRTLVSGHWRNQVSGARKDAFGNAIPAENRAHELIFIEPFWRGPEWVPSIEPVRVAK